MKTEAKRSADILQHQWAPPPPPPSVSVSTSASPRPLPSAFQFSDPVRHAIQKNATALTKWWKQSKQVNFAMTTTTVLPKPDAAGYDSIPAPIRSFMESNPFPSFRQVYEYQFSLLHTQRSVTLSLTTFATITTTTTRGETDKTTNTNERRHQDEKIVRDAFRRCWTWLQFCDEFADSVTVTVAATSSSDGGGGRCLGDGIHVFLYWTPFTKRIPTSASSSVSPWIATQINEIHVNTAFTYACVAQGTVVIFRQEEWFKVFVHETMHAFGFDFATIPLSVSNYTSRLFSRLFPFLPSSSQPDNDDDDNDDDDNNDHHHDLRIYEAYTECWAEFFDVLLFCICHNYDFFGQVGQDMLVREREFTKYQVKKLFGGGRSIRRGWSELTSAVPGVLLGKYREDTHVFSYFLVKWLLFRDLPAFLEWCLRTNLKNAWFVFLERGRERKQAHRHAKEFCQWVVDKSMATESILSNDYESPTLYDQLSEDTSSTDSQYWRETLRMTP